MDPHFFADPDPGSQTVMNPTDPDPTHWFKLTYSLNDLLIFEQVNSLIGICLRLRI